jgi:hypothetical protein
LVGPGKPTHVVGEIDQTGAVAKQLADRDVLPAGNNAGEVAIDRVVETKLPLLGQSEDDRGCEGFRNETAGLRSDEACRMS